MTRFKKILLGIVGAGALFLVASIAYGVSPTRQELGGTGTSTIFTTGNLITQGSSGYSSIPSSTYQVAGNYITNAYASSTFPSFTYATSTFYQASNPNSYIALTGLTGTSPITYNNSTGAIGFNGSGYVGNLYASSTFSTYSYGTSTYATILSYPTYGYASSTYYLATNPSSYISGNQSITLSGDVSGTGATAITTAIGAGKVTNTMLAGSIAASKLVGSDIATVGTVTSGTWQGSVIQPTYGGTGTSTAPTIQGQLLAADGTAKYTPTNLIAGTNITITTSTPGQITIAASGSSGVSNLYASSTFPSFTYASSTFVTSVTGSGNIASSGGLTPQITFTGVLPVANGGTGNTSVTAGDILFGNGTSALATSSVFTFSATTGLTVNATSTLGTSTISRLTLGNAIADGCMTLSSGLVTSTGSACGSASGISNAYGSSTFPSFGYASSTFVNFTYATNTFATIANYPTYTYASSTFHTGAGTNGQVPYYTGANTLSSTAKLLFDGVHFGFNATSSTIGFNVQGTAGTDDIFNVASSSGTSFLKVTALGQVLIAPTGRLTIPQGASPTLSGIGDIAYDTTDGQFLVNASSTGSAPLVLASSTIRSITWESPTAADNITFFRANRDMTIVGADCMQTSGVNNPSTTINIRHFSDRSTTTGNTLLSANVACTATTTAQSLTINGSNKIAAGEWVWAITSATSNSSSTNITLYAQDDRK